MLFFEAFASMLRLFLRFDIKRPFKCILVVHKKYIINHQTICNKKQNITSK